MKKVRNVAVKQVLRVVPAMFLAMCLTLILVAVPEAQAKKSEHRLGGGVNYWVMMDDLDDKKFDDKGLSYLVSYQYWSSIFGFEVAGELMPKWFDETAIAPQAYFLVGGLVYVGAGIGILYSDGDFADDPFFALKAGVNLELIPGTKLDISANYRFSGDESLKNTVKKIDTDTLFLGAAFRFSL